MDEAVARAADLIDRLEPMGLSAGLTEEDFIGDSVREPLCSCLTKVAAALSALPVDGQLVHNTTELKPAIESLKAAAGSQRSASSGRLNAALSRLAAAIDPPAPPTAAAAAAGAGSSRSRVVCAEIIVAHLQAAAIWAHKQQQQQQQQQEVPPVQQQQQVQVQAGESCAGAMDVDEEGDAAASAQLQGIARLLGMDQMPASALGLLGQVLQQLQGLVAQLPPTFFQPLVSMQELQPGQNQLLQEVDDALRSEYKVRRRMLIERIKVTLQSFLWSPRVSAKGTKPEVEALIRSCQAQLHEAPGVTLEQLGTACAADLAGVMRRATSGEGGSIDASVKRVVIGKVPDRGGRPEGRAREANMPDWAPRKEGGGGGGGGGQQGGRGGGGRGGGRGGGGGRSQQGGGGRGGGGRGGGGKGGWGRRS